MGKKSGFTSAEIEEIKRLYLQEGRSILQIPKILGKGSENSVRNALHKARGKHAPEERTKLERFKPDQVFGNVWPSTFEHILVACEATRLPKK